MEFNKQQNEAINSINGPVMVISCAGSGKTSVIIERTNKIIQSGVSSNRILVVTFSKAAAAEMENKFIKTYENRNVNFSTIHSVCYSILAKEYGLIPTSILKANEKIAFLRDEYMILKKKFGKAFEEQFRDMDEYYKYMEISLSGYMILMYKDKLHNSEAVISDKYVRSIYDAYIKFKKMAGKIDFDDMIIESHKCLKVKSDVLGYWQNLCEFIMIDEYQDTNILQAEIFFMLAGDKKNICVVGDDDQSIYSFRDADSKIFDKFIKEYPETKRILLETNYRSKPQIVNLAACLINNNLQRFTKKFHTYKKGDSKVEIVAVDGSADQATEVVRIIEDYKQKNVPLNSIAILYRVKKEALIISNRLQAEKIPFFTKELPEDLHSGMVFRDIKAYYRLANDLWDSLDLHRIINRPNRFIKTGAVINCEPNKNEVLRRCINGIKDGKRKEQINTVIEQLFSDLEVLKEKKPLELMKYLLDNMKYRDALEEFANFIGTDPRRFWDEFDELYSESEKFDTMAAWDSYAMECRNQIINEMKKHKNDGVYLSTFHSSKGLEWDNVIIISANDGVTPLIRCDNIENPEEERRLFYVAITRAKEELSVLYFKDDERKDKNTGNCILPSRYIAEMNTNTSERVIHRNVLKVKENNIESSEAYDIHDEYDDIDSELPETYELAEKYDCW